MTKRRIMITAVIMAVIGIIAVTAVRNQKKEYAVIVSQKAEDTELYAADVLSFYLSEISREPVPVLYDNQPFEGYGFYIGNAAPVDSSALEGEGDGSYVLMPLDRGLAIYGAGNRGTIYGAFGFLEDYCGFRCFTKDRGMESLTGKITLPKKRVDFHTSFEFTDTDWLSPYDPVYSLANGLNGGPHRMLTPEQGGAVEYLGGYCHTLSTLFCSAGTYFEEHPEYFAFYEGERLPYQLCLTNEEVYEIVLSEVLGLLENEGDPNAALQIVSLSQADNPYYCQCEKCREIDAANGSQSGTMITFVNRIAKAVKEAGFDNTAVDTFAYQYSRKAPSSVVPEENVIVRFCTIEGCFSHALNDPECPANRELMQDLEAWNRICDRIYIWDYTTNYAYTLGIFPDFHVLQANMQCFYEHGVKGVYEEGVYYISQCDTEFGELRAYLISRLLRDPYCDYSREMELFCNAYYGKGGSDIRRFIERVSECSRDKHVSIYTVTTESFAISEKQAEELDRLWLKAKRASAGDEKALAAIKRSELSWRYVKGCIELREFQGDLSVNMEEREKLYDDLIAHGVEMIDEMSWIKASFEPYRYIPVDGWRYADFTYILFYDANGGEKAPVFQWSDGYIVITDQVPERAGYSFLGWSPDQYAQEALYQPGEAFILTENLTLYAVWSEEGTS